MTLNYLPKQLNKCINDKKNRIPTLLRLNSEFTFRTNLARLRENLRDLSLPLGGFYFFTRMDVDAGDGGTADEWAAV